MCVAVHLNNATTATKVDAAQIIDTPVTAAGSGDFIPSTEQIPDTGKCNQEVNKEAIGNSNACNFKSRWCDKIIAINN